MASEYEMNMEGPPSKKQRGSSPAPPKFDNSDLTWNLVNEFNSELPDELGHLGGSNVSSTNMADLSSPSGYGGGGSSSSSSKKADDTIQRNINLSLLLSSNNDPRVPLDTISLPQQISSVGHMNPRYPMSRHLHQHPQPPHQQQQQQQQMMMMYHMPGQRQSFGGSMQHGGYVGSMNNVYARSPVAVNYPLRHPDFMRQKSLPASMPFYPDDTRTARMNGNVFSHGDPMMMDRGFNRNPFPMRNEGPELCGLLGVGGIGNAAGAGTTANAANSAKIPNGLMNTAMPHVLPSNHAKNLVSSSSVNLQTTCILTDAKTTMSKSGATTLPAGKFGVLSPENNVFPISPAAPPEMTEGPPTVVLNPEKRREVQEVQHKLVLLLHAHKCQRKEQANGISLICHVAGCSTMKGLLKHMTECQEGKSCKVQHCVTLRQIITHWKNCDRLDCPICSPLKNSRPLSQQNQAKSSTTSSSTSSADTNTVSSAPIGASVSLSSRDDMTRTYETLGLDPNNHLQRPNANPLLQSGGATGNATVANKSVAVAASSSQDITVSNTTTTTGSGNPLYGSSSNSSSSSSSSSSSTSKPTKEWHHTVIQDLRNHLIHKLVQAIFPTPDPNLLLLKNERMNNVVQYAKKVEGDMYETANSREEYYLLLAEKIYKIQKELEEKRMKRMIDVGNSSGSNASGFPHCGLNDSLIDSGFSSPPLTSVYSVTHSPGGSGNRVGNDVYSDMCATNSNVVRARGDTQFINSRLGVDVYAKRMPQPQAGAMLPYGCPDVQQPANGQVSRSGLIDSADHSVNCDAKLPNTDVIYCRNEQPVDQLKPTDSLASSSLQQPPLSLSSSLPSLTRPPIGAPPPAASTQSAVSYAEAAGASSSCESPREIVIGGGKPGSALAYSTSSPLGQNEKVPAAVDGSKPPSSPSFGTMKEAAEIEVKLEPKSPLGFKYESSAVHEDISDDDVETIKPERDVEVKVEIKAEAASLEADDGSDKMNNVVEVKEEMTRKTEESKQDDCSVKTEMTDVAESSAAASNGGEMEVEKPEFGRKVWAAEELLHALLPTWEKLYNLEPEAAPFRFPVNPEELGIPDYFDIVKNPIDLSTIRGKLEAGEYNDPWQYVDDVCLMFDNAWLYNRKTSRVYKFCSKLAEVFESEIDGVMQSLGFCCGRRHVFSPQVLCCFGKQLCAIPRDTTYYNYQDRYIYCERCFNELNGEDIEMADDPSQPGLKIKKEQFVKEKNDKLDRELFITCQCCGRKMHRICVLYMEQIWPEGFTCSRCLKGKNMQKKENKYTAKRLPQTKLSAYLENRVNSLLKRKDAGAGDVSIRVLSSYDKAVEVKPCMKSRFVHSDMPETFPYRVKAMFAFEEIDGIDVCFFGMHVQEYGSDCRPPNARRVYIAYLDSVHFFQPKQFRTMVYHEILIGYLDYVKLLGYQTAHIWACPPSEGDDYIFHCHPPDQKIPKPKRLQEWYKKMLDKAVNDRVIFDYKDILKDAIDNDFKSVTQIPYFEGDFWPNILEECIKELEQEETEKRLREEEEAAADTEDLEPAAGDNTEVQLVAGKKKGQKNSGNTKKKNTKSKKPSNRKSKSGHPHGGNDLSAKLWSTMEKHKEGFFVVRLQQSNEASEIKDPDPLINCDLMDGRDAFLTLSRDKHYEFSSLRRAKYSTMGLLYELHTQAKDGFIYTCNDCKANVETRYHCVVCEDFDLCVPCYQTSDHPHKSKMSRLGLDLDDGNSNDAKSQNTQEARRVSLQTYIQSLVHACHCRDANCHRTICQKMKRLVQHVRNCKRRQNNNGCPVCKQVLTLCWNHAKTCKESKCLVPFCPNMKQKLEQQHAEQQFKQNQLLRRRMAIMQRAPDADLVSEGHQPTSGPPTPTTAMTHGFCSGGKLMHGGGGGCPSPMTMGMLQQQQRQMGASNYPPGVGGPMMGPMMHQRQFIRGPAGHMMDQMSPVGNWQHDIYQGMQQLARPADDIIYSQQPQHMMGPAHGQGMPSMDMSGMAHGMEPMGMQGQPPGQQAPMATSASSQMAVLLAAKQMKMPVNSVHMVGKDMVGFVKANSQMMPRYMKQNPSNSDHVMAASGMPLSGGMSAGGHMMDDMMDDPHMGHMSMMPNSMGGMRTMMAGEQMGQGGAGRMGSPQWLQQQQQFQQHQQMRCMQSEYQRYPHMSQQAMGMYGGNLPPQVQRVRMNFQGGMAHPQGFGGDGMMMQYGSMSHLQQQQQQQMALNQKRIQLKTQMGAALRPSAGLAPMSATSIGAQRGGIGQMPVEMAPQQPPAATPQQPALPCSSLASSMSSQAGLRMTHGLVKRAPSPRRPPPHYTDTVSMQSMARRTVTGMMPAAQHGAPEMNAYGADHLRFPVGMVPDYGSSIGGAPQMDNVQQFSNSTHGALPRFPNNMPQ